MPSSTNPINNTPYIGYRVETVEDDDGNVVQPSTLANQRAEQNPGHNPDFFESDGKSKDEQNEIGKGANPSADIVTKNVTTIDPVYREPTPVADGRTIVETVPASLPLDAPVTRASGRVDYIGEPVEEGDEKNYTDGVLVRTELKAGAGRNGKIDDSEIKTEAKVVYGSEAEEAAKKNEEIATGNTEGATPAVKTAAPVPVKGAAKEEPVKVEPVKAPAVKDVAPVKTDQSKK